VLDTLRAYALEQLQARPDEYDAARDVHALHYLDRLAGIPPWRNLSLDLRTEFEPDLGNILVAADHAAAGDGRNGAPVRRAAEPLVYLLTNLGLYDEARRRCGEALAGELDDVTRGKVLTARAYLEATQDGTSNFVAIANEALPYLTPGDGVWAGTFGLTSVVNHMFAPDLAVPALEAARQRLDDQGSAAADHDRAMLDFYLGGALMSQRAYERAVGVQLRAAQLLGALAPTSLFRLWTMAGAVMSLTMLDRFVDAAAMLDAVAPLAGWTDWSVDWYFASAFLAAREGRFDDARDTLHTIGTRFDNAGVSPMTSTVLAGFGALAHLEGRDEHARHLFEPLVATRATASTAVLHEMVGEVEGWTDDDFAQRRFERLVDIVPRLEAMPRPEFFALLGGRLREELAASAV
jgi:hypothetical protein